jgi:hypothetical protein
MSEIVKKDNRGGKRIGAGRPHKAVEDATQSILLELFDERAERQIVEAMIKRAVWSASDSASVSAATWLWDRKYGKVTEKTESHHTIDVTRLSDDELERLVKGS